MRISVSAWPSRRWAGRRVLLAVSLFAACGLVATAALAADEASDPPAAEVPAAPVPVPRAEPPALLPIQAPGAPQPAPLAPGGGAGNPAGAAEAGSDPSAAARNDFISDRIAERMIERARQKLAEEEYRDAVKLLQAVLDRPQDGLILSDSKSGRFQSAKAVADALLGELPPEGQRVYETQFGLGARQELERAIAEGDWSKIEEISESYFRTKAGMEATYRLAIRAIDRGEPLVGALMLDRLRKAGAEQFEPQLTMRLLLAARRAGMKHLLASARANWESFLANGGFEEGQRPLAPRARRRFSRWLQNPGERIGVAAKAISPTLTGSRDGTSGPRPLTVAGGAVWSYSFDGSHSPPGTHDSLDRLLGRAVEQVRENAASLGDITLPASSPVIVGQTAIFRTVRDIRAVDITSGRLLWRSAQPHRLLFDHVLSDIGSLFASDFQHRQSQNLAAQVYLAQRLWRNMTSGMLTTDGRRVYAVVGTGLGKSNVQIVGAPRNGRPHELGKETYNTLIAYDLSAEGRIAWMIGGPPESSRTTGLYFLGPPLAVGHRLFALAEQDGRILLVAIDPDPQASSRILWRQPLTSPKARLNADPLRRISGLMPSFSRGLLICPTGTGAIIAVDLRNRTIQWGYRYQRRDVTPGAGRVGAFGDWRLLGLDEIDRRQRWIDSVPRIAGSFVLMTPRDSNKIHCLDLHTGELLWSESRGQFRYIGAVIDERVILVGSEEIAAFALQSGDRLWRLPLEVDQKPAGRGILSGEVYYWPTKGGTICSLDWRTGQMLGAAELGEGLQPGNLAAAGGRLISVSTQAIVGFRNVHSFDNTGKPAGAQSLALRGEHRLMRGELAAGVADLQAAIKKGAGRRAHEALIRTLLEGLRRDFASFRQYAGQLKKMLHVPARSLEFAQVYAEGLAAAGEPLEAATLLLDSLESAETLADYRQVSAERRVRLDRLIRAQLGRIYDAADERTKQRIDESIIERMTRLREAGRTKALQLLATIAYGTGARRALLGTLQGRLQEAGKDLRARLVGMELARIAGEAGVDEEKQAGKGESHHTPRLAPGARLEEGVGFPHPLAAYYQPNPADAAPRRNGIETTLPIRLVGPVPPEFQGWRLRMNATRRELIAQDATGRERWRITIYEGPRGVLPRSVDRFRARFYGPLLAVCADTLMAVFETNATGEPPRLLWTKNLSVTGEIRFQIRAPGAVRASGRPSSRFGFAGPRVILLRANHRTVAVNSVTGELLWSVAGENLDRALLGNSRFVALAASPERLLVRRTADGSLVERRREETVAARIATRGSRMIRWEKTESGFALACLDLIEQSPQWRHEFPASAMLRYVGHDAVAVFDPASGRLQLIRWTDGQLLFETEIKPKADIRGFHLLPAGENFLFFTQEGTPKQFGRTPRLGRPWMAFSGTVRALEANGETIWEEELTYCLVHQDLPRALPLLVTVRSTPNGITQNDPWTLQLIDVRTGKTLIETARSKTFAPMAIEADPSGERIEIRVPMGRFVVEPANGADGGPRNDTR